MASKRILVIDDDKDMREITQISLQGMAGWETLLADCGQEGLARARDDRPDAILLDVTLPDMDGPSLYGKLREDGATRDIPVIFLTGRSGAADQQRLTNLGVQGLIPKPFNPTTLASDICRKLGWPEQ